MFRNILTVLLVLVLLAGCGDSAKEKAATQALADARAQEQVRPVEQVIDLYQAVIDKYPETKQAEEAKLALAEAKVRLQRVLFKRNAGAVLERVSTVLNGYRAFSGKLPANLKDLDADGYMFDSQYLADVLPEGSALYLTLDSSNGETRMWLQQTGQQLVLSRTLSDEQLADLKLEELTGLKAKWQEIASVGRLTQVKL